MDNERVLVLRLTQGDEDAFCELYARYKSRLVYFAMRYLKSQEYAEDIFQDTFAVIWQSRHFINPDASFSSYLYTIMRNRILNQLRSLEAEDTLKEYIIAQAIDYEDTIQDRIGTSDLKRLLEQALEKLTPRQREVFRMSRELQMSHREIAEALGISVYTVQEHLSVSLRVLRSFLLRNHVSGVDFVLLLFLLY